MTNVEEAEGELSLARVALAEDDLAHAAKHIAGALGVAPTLPEAHELLAVLAARSDDGAVSLFPIESGPYVGTVVGRAHLLAPTAPEEALMLLARATAFDPSKPWADVAWVHALDTSVLDPDELVRILVTVIGGLSEPVADEIRAANKTYLDLTIRAVAAFPDHAVINGAAAGLGRRLGDLAQAIAWGERGYRLEPTKLTAVWYAYALKADGQLDAGLRVMAEARQQNPLDLDLCADMSSWLADAGRLDEALTIIEEAMQIDPTYDCAVHTAHRLRFRRDGDARHLIDLSDFIRANPVSSHEHSDLADSCDGRSWLGQPEVATESVINVLGQIPAEQRRHELELAVSALEVPSAIAVMRRECPNVSISIGETPADMTEPLQSGPVLWHYDGTIATPATVPPLPESAALLAQTTTVNWAHPVAAYDHALPLGQLPVGELLALLVHPPARPAERGDLPDGWWERSTQVYACLGLLHSEELRSTKLGDTRQQRQLLTRVAYGIEDWTTEAALFALVVAAWLDPSCRAEVADTVGRRFVKAVEASRGRAVTIRGSLAGLVLITPDMPDSVRTLARELLAKEEPAPETDSNEPEHAAPPALEIPRQKRRSLWTSLRGVLRRR